MTERDVTSSCGKVQASPSTSIPSVARSRRSEALARITNASGLSWFLISSAISFTIRWLTLHIFWPCSSSLAIQGCKSFSACETNMRQERWQDMVHIHAGVMVKKMPVLKYINWEKRKPKFWTKFSFDQTCEYSNILTWRTIAVDALVGEAETTSQSASTTYTLETRIVIHPQC